jgi:hemerythrin-like domain-containing protein
MDASLKPMLSRLGSRFSPSVTDMIRMDHSQIMAAFHRFKPGARAQTRLAVVDTACLAIEIHSQLEDEILYPALYDLVSDRAAVEESVAEHDDMQRLVTALRGMRPEDAAYDSTFTELMRQVMHHVAEEETVLLPEAERLLGERIGDLGAKMAKRRVQLTAPHAGEIARNTARAVPTMTVLLAAGALIAGTYVVKRTFTRPPAS